MWDRWVPNPQPESRTLQHVMEERMASRPFKEAYHFMRAASPLRWSNEDLKRHSEALATGLLDMGYKRGAKLAVWAGNDKEVPAVMLGLGFTGNHMVGVDPSIGVSDVRDVLGDLGCRGLLFTPRWGMEERSEAVSSIVEGLDDVKAHPGRIIRSKGMRSLRHLIDLKLQSTPGIHTIAQVPVYDPSPSPLPEVRRLIHAEWPLFTSIRPGAGGSGWEAGKTLSTAQALNFGAKLAEAAGITADGTVLVTAPLHTVLGSCGGVLGAMTSGAKFVMVRSAFDAKGTLDTLTRQRITTLVATSEQLAELTDLLAADAASSEPKYGAPFLKTVVADEAFSAAGSAPSQFAGAGVILADSRRDDSAL